MRTVISTGIQIVRNAFLISDLAPPRVETEPQVGLAPFAYGLKTSVEKLTLCRSLLRISMMQMTIDIPDNLARRLEPERDHLAQIISRGLRRSWSSSSDLRTELISFLAGRPTSA